MYQQPPYSRIPNQQPGQGPQQYPNIPQHQQSSRFIVYVIVYLHRLNGEAIGCGLN